MKSINVLCLVSLSAIYAATPEGTPTLQQQNNDVAVGEATTHAGYVTLVPNSQINNQEVNPEISTVELGRLAELGCESAQAYLATTHAGPVTLVPNLQINNQEVNHETSTDELKRFAAEGWKYAQERVANAVVNGQ